MTEHRRNIAVGFTVLASLAAILFMIMLFGEAPAFARRGYVVTIELPRAGGLSKGADVRLNGKRVGTVARVELREDPRDGVEVDCRIESGVRIPRDVRTSVATIGLGGAAHMALATAGRAGSGDWLATDGTARIDGEMGSGGLLGSDMSARVESIAEAVESFSRLADKIDRLLESLMATVSPTTAPTGGLAGTVHRLNKALDGFNAVIADLEGDGGLAQSLAKFQVAIDNGAKAMAELEGVAAAGKVTLRNVDEGVESVKATADVARARIDTLSAKLTEDAELLGKLLTSLNKAAGKLDAGEGSAAKLINDPQLYNNMLETTRQLSRTLKELQTTVMTWRKDGVKIKLD